MGAGDRKELIGPPIIYENPYTGTPLAGTASSGTSNSPYTRQSSSRVSWGAAKKHSVMWVESQWNIEGELNLYPGTQIDPLSIVTLKGIGESLSGKWWVNTVTYSIQEGGLTVSAHVMRDAYGKDTPDTADEGKPRKEEITPSTDEADTKKYIVKSGDTLWTIANRFYGDGGQFTKIASANNLVAPYTITPSQELVIP